MQEESPYIRLCSNGKLLIIPLKSPANLSIQLGGDGTVLYASWLFQQIVPPVFSFSLGSLGFLTKFDYESYPAMLERSFTVGITASLRLRFQCS